MKPLLLMMIAAPILSAGCALLPAETGSSDQNKPLAFADDEVVRHAKTSSTGTLMIRDANGNAIVQKVPFRAGVSSSTVERLARRFGCTGGVGAGLLTEAGPLEIYRMQCENGMTFMAQCELRQCRPMR